MKDIIDLIDANRAAEEFTRVKLTKLSEAPDPEFPNNIPTGEVRIGLTMNPPEEGVPFGVIHSMSKYFRTSPVVKVNDDGTFETVNSIYKLELHED